MTWYALQSPRAEDVAEDARAQAIPTLRPTFVLEYWNPRLSVRVTREQALFPGVVFLGAPRLDTRHPHRYIPGHDGPCPVRDSAIDELRARLERHEFDVRLARPLRLSAGAHVFVTLLELAGTVLRRLRGHVYLVLLDSGREVQVGMAGLEVVSA